MVLEIRLNLRFHSLLRSLLLGVSRSVRAVAALSTIDWFLAEVPEVNFTVINTSSQLVNIWEVLKALDEVIHEPRCVLGSICDILLALLIPGNFLLFAATGTCDLLVLIRHEVRVT